MKAVKLMATVAALAAVAAVSYAAGGKQKQKASVVVRASELKWAPQAPGLPQQLAALWGDRNKGAHGVLIRLPPGFDSGLHAHTGDYHGVLVSGTWIHVDEGGAGADRELTPGSYVMQPGKGMHIDRCKPGAECVLFIYQSEKADVIFPRK